MLLAGGFASAPAQGVAAAPAQPEAEATPAQAGPATPGARARSPMPKDPSPKDSSPKSPSSPSQVSAHPAPRPHPACPCGNRRKARSQARRKTPALASGEAVGCARGRKRARPRGGRGPVRGRHRAERGGRREERGGGGEGRAGAAAGRHGGGTQAAAAGGRPPLVRPAPLVGCVVQGLRSAPSSLLSPLSSLLSPLSSLLAAPHIRSCRMLSAHNCCVLHALQRTVLRALQAPC